MFNINSGSLIIIDPSRNKHIWCAVKVNCKIGIWQYEKLFLENKLIGITITHTVADNFNWELMQDKIITDSKHIGIFDYLEYPELGYRSDFDIIRSITNEDLHVSYVTDYGFATLHPYTDWTTGEYQYSIAKSPEEEIIGIKIDFV